MEGNEEFICRFVLFLVYLNHLFVLVYSDVKLATTPDINIVVDSSMFFQILEPESISYTFKIKPSKDIGTPFSMMLRSVDLRIAEPYEACSPLSNSVSGSVVMVSRGSCSFVSKTYIAQEAGAVAVIITDNNTDNDMSMIQMVDDETQRQTSIPSLFLLGKDGAMIKRELEKLGLDNAIIDIPVNITGILPHQTHRTPWTIW